MSNVTIKDLPRKEEMDSNDMAAIEVGRMVIPPPPALAALSSLGTANFGGPNGPWNDKFDSPVQDILDTFPAE
jgi:hypothetical protein